MLLGCFFFLDSHASNALGLIQSLFINEASLSSSPALTSVILRTQAAHGARSGLNKARTSENKEALERGGGGKRRQTSPE